VKVTGKKTRVVRQTLLVVGEGDAEIAFVRHLKAIYRDALGRAVQEANAHGKGGRHVLETAVQRARNRDYDKVILLLDTARIGARPSGPGQGEAGSVAEGVSMSLNQTLAWRPGSCGFSESRLKETPGTSNGSSGNASDARPTNRGGWRSVLIGKRWMRPGKQSSNWPI